MKNVAIPKLATKFAAKSLRSGGESAALNANFIGGVWCITWGVLLGRKAAHTAPTSETIPARLMSSVAVCACQPGTSISTKAGAMKPMLPHMRML